MTYEITFREELEADSTDDVIEWLFEYFNECNRYGDVSAFTIVKISEENN